MSVLGREPRGLNEPYGIAFYPAGPDPKWIYVGDADSVMRFAYRTGDLEATGVAARVVDLPHGSGHWTRDVVLFCRRQDLVRCGGLGIERPPFRERTDQRQCDSVVAICVVTSVMSLWIGHFWATRRRSSRCAALKLPVSDNAALRR